MTVIEFRSGSYFTSADAPTGGTIIEATRFDSAEAAEKIMQRYPWILANGGMVVPAPRVVRAWSRKEAIENINGKHVTIGSIVRCASAGRRDHAITVPYGATGRVIASGNAQKTSAKNAIGTTAAMLVEWFIFTPAPRVTGPMPIVRLPTPTASGIDEIRSDCAPTDAPACWRARFEFLKAGKVVVRTVAVRPTQEAAVNAAAGAGYYAAANPPGFAFAFDVDIDGVVVSTRNPAPEPEILS